MACTPHITPLMYRLYLYSQPEKEQQHVLHTHSLCQTAGPGAS